MIASIRWLTDSIVLYNDNRIMAYYYGYDKHKKTVIQPLYSEITGYGVSLMVNLYNLYKSGFRGKFLDILHGLVDYLTWAWENRRTDAIPYGYDTLKNSWIHDYYSFDNAMIIDGLLDATKIVSNKKLIDIAEKIGTWLIEKMQNHDGSFRAMHRPSMREYIDFKEWYGDKGSLHGKNAIALAKLWKMTGNEIFYKSLLRLLNWLLKLQTPQGWFRAKENEEYVFHHAHCYALEGLLYSWYTTNDKKILDAVIRGAKWLIKIQGRSGGIPMRYPETTNVYATDATSQAARIWLILYLITGSDYFLKAADKALSFLNRNSFSNVGDRNTEGALPYTIRRIAFINILSSRIYTWTVMFYVHALLLRSNIDNMELGNVLEHLF